MSCCSGSGGRRLLHTGCPKWPFTRAFDVPTVEAPGAQYKSMVSRPFPRVNDSIGPSQPFNVGSSRRKAAIISGHSASGRWRGRYGDRCPPPPHRVPMDPGEATHPGRPRPWEPAGVCGCVPPTPGKSAPGPCRPARARRVSARPN